MKLEHIRIARIEAEALMGHQVDKCIRECVLLAAERGEDVTMDFNGTIYDINVADISKIATKRTPD